MPIRIRSDRLKEYKKEMEEMTEYMERQPEYVPVDAFGARTDYVKGENNLAKAGKDIKERFDMDLPNTREDLKGGE